jgi:hypothetical protein
MATTSIKRTATSSTSVQKCTFSFWVKRSKLGTDQTIFFCGYTADFGQYSYYINFQSDDTLDIKNDDAGTTLRYITNRKFRDTNAWYHICIANDLTETGNDRCKLYINGVQETSFSTQTAMSGDQFLTGKTGYTQVIGRHEGGTNKQFDGLLSHFYYIDGYAYQSSTFGSTDATTGEWKINTSPTVTMGTNGFLVLKDGNTITDQSSNSNDLTLNTGTLTKSEDNPSNLFATWNPLMPNSITYSNGNTTCTNTADANYRNAWTTLATNTTGKYYAEFKAVSGFSAINKAIGYVEIEQTYDGDAHLEAYSLEGSYGSNGRVSYNQTIDSSVPTFTGGDIIGIALDLDNGKAYYHKNGTYINSGDPTSGASGTGGYTLTTGKQYAFASITINQGGANVWSANFGNGYFGTTAVASAQNPDDGIGIFEYDVPANYKALSTKGLNS